jgi:hypothetical protein
MYINYLLYVLVFFINDFEKSKTLTGKIFCTQDLYFLYFLTDSTVECSLRTIGGEKKYKVKQDSLSILEDYSITEYHLYDEKNIKTTHVKKWDSYQIIANNSDSLFILYHYLSQDSVEQIDTLKFTDAEKMREPINNFKMFSYNVSDFNLPEGNSISVDSLGNLVIFNEPKYQLVYNKKRTHLLLYNEKRKHLLLYTKKRKHLLLDNKIRVNLSEEELKNFISILSFAQLSKLPKDIGNCSPDPVYNTYTIEYGDKAIYSRSCDFSPFHFYFLNLYLYKLEKKYGRKKKLSDMQFTAPLRDRFA